jgi:hypothetical protein
MAPPPESMAAPDRVSELVDAVEGRGLGPWAAMAEAMASAVLLAGPMAAASTATIAAAVPAALALATTIVLGQCGLPGEPKLASIEGHAGWRRDQGQGRAAGQETPAYGGASARS